jgi:hypothetical protein
MVAINMFELAEIGSCSVDATPASISDRNLGKLTLRLTNASL